VVDFFKSGERKTGEAANKLSEELIDTYSAIVGITNKYRQEKPRDDEQEIHFSHLKKLEDFTNFVDEVVDKFGYVSVESFIARGDGAWDKKKIGEHWKEASILIFPEIRLIIKQWPGKVADKMPLEKALNEFENCLDKYYDIKKPSEQQRG